MKHLSTLVLTSLFSFSAFADVITVECTPPQMLTGGASIEMTELVKSKKKTSEGYSIYKGVMKVRIGGSTQKPVFDGPVKVQGVALMYGALNLQAKNSKVSNIFIDQDGISYVEMTDGKMYNTECRYY